MDGPAPRGGVWMRNRCAIVLLVAMVFVGAGCAPLIFLGIVGGAGGGAYVWYRGWLEQTIDAPQDRVFRAARSALRDLDVVIEDDTLEADRGVLDGYDNQSQRVMVKTVVAGEKATKVRVRVGFWGDQQRSIQILDQLKKHL